MLLKAKIKWNVTCKNQISDRIKAKTLLFNNYYTNMSTKLFDLIPLRNNFTSSCP